ncbi:MAG: hypothetical protein R3C53_05315 [Pirellulaceae bacterium]
MPKYYVQSGNVRTIISADDPEKAALWVVHKAMQQVVPVYEDLELTPHEKSQAAVVQGVMVLGNTMQVGEAGFDSADSQHLDTFELVSHWHQLMLALSKLDAMMCAATAT